MKILLVTFVALVLAACNPMAQMDDSERLIAEFHQDLSAGDTNALWNDMSEETQAETPRDQFDELIELVRNSMGEYQDGSRTGFNVSTNNGVTTTEITMSTTYANGSATETFVFNGQGDAMRIQSWNIDAPAMLRALSEAAENPDSALDVEFDGSVEVVEN